MADSKVSGLSRIVRLLAEDLFHVVDDPNGTPVNKKLNVKQLFGAVPANTKIDGTFTANTDRIRVVSSHTPANSTASGTEGDVAWDSNYVYVATANNVWKRTPLSSF